MSGRRAKGKAEWSEKKHSGPVLKGLREIDDQYDGYRKKKPKSPESKKSAIHKTGSSPIAGTIDPRKGASKKTVFGVSIGQQTNRHPCEIHKKVGCRICVKLQATKVSRTRAYRRRFIQK